MRIEDVNKDEIKQIIAFVMNKCAEQKDEIGTHYLLTIIASLIASAAHEAAPQLRVIIWDTLNQAMSHGNTIAMHTEKPEMCEL